MQNNRQIIPLVLFVLIILVHTQIYAGAWVHKKNGYYFRLYSSYLFATEEFNYRGDKQDLYEEHLGYTNSFFRDISIVIYSEYALTDNLTLIGELPFKSLTLKRTVASYYGWDELATTSGFADLRISGKLGIIDNPLALSFQGGITIPTGYSKEPENDGPRLGSGDINLEGHFLFGSSFYPLPLYFSGSAGYRHRTGELNDEIIFTGELGYTIGNFFIKAYAEILRNVVQPPDIYGQRIVTPLPGGGGVTPDVIIGDQHLTKLIPSITYKINQTLGLQAEMIKPLSGTNALNGITYSLGLIFSN